MLFETELESSYRNWIQEYIDTHKDLTEEQIVKLKRACEETIKFIGEPTTIGTKVNKDCIKHCAINYCI